MSANGPELKFSCLFLAMSYQFINILYKKYKNLKKNQSKRNNQTSLIRFTMERHHGNQKRNEKRQPIHSQQQRLRYNECRKNSNSNKGLSDKNELH